MMKEKKRLGIERYILSKYNVYLTSKYKFIHQPYNYQIYMKPRVYHSDIHTNLSNI